MEKYKYKIQFISLIILSILFYPITYKLIFSVVFKEDNNQSTDINTKAKIIGKERKNTLFKAKVSTRDTRDIEKGNFPGHYILPSENSMNCISSNSEFLDLKGNVVDAYIFNDGNSAKTSEVYNVLLLRQPDNPSSTVNGLDFNYYQGKYKNIPDIRSLNLIKTEKVPSFEVHKFRLGNFVYNYSGFIEIPKDGIYTFYTNSDEGSKLYIGNQLIINNNEDENGNIIKEVSGTIGLKKGKHTITVTCLDNNKKHPLKVSYSSTLLPKQPIPATALFSIPGDSLREAEIPYPSFNGLNYAYYEGQYNKISDFTFVPPVNTGSVTNFDISPKLRKDHFAFNFKGYINVPCDGLYTFYIDSYKGSILSIGNEIVVADDSIDVFHERVGTIGLKKGNHPISVSYLNFIPEQDIIVSYSGPAITKQIIPNSSLYRVNSYNAKSLRKEGSLEYNNVIFNPTPFVDHLDIKILEKSGKAEIVITELSTKALVFKKEVNFTDTGIRLDLSKVKNGWYLVSIRKGLKQYDKIIQIKR